MSYGKYLYAAFSAIVFSIATSANAQNLPGSADPSRIQPQEQMQQAPTTPNAPPATQVPEPIAQPPENAEQLTFVLKDMYVDGVTAFTHGEMFMLYRDYLGKEISLKNVWDIAAAITKRYRDEGYFLSRAFIPAQEINGGAVHIQVVEGYIGEIVFEDNAPKNRVIKELAQRILSERPTTSERLESVLMRLNDLAGYELGFLLEANEAGALGETRLMVSQKKEGWHGVAELNNYGSRYLGPYQAILTAQKSFYPAHLTTASILTTTQTDELKYGAIAHEWQFAPEWTLDASASYVMAEPGATLEPSKIDSQSFDLWMGLNYQPIRQRRENLRYWLRFGMRDTKSDILSNNPLTRDKIRAARIGLAYDTDDRWKGYNYFSAQLSKGMSGLGGSDEGDSYLSRAQADPSFTKLNLDVTRYQALGLGFNAVGHVAGQLASAPLFSSEEFGLGGQEFGRAYDPSEFTGDSAIAGSLELQYGEVADFYGVHLTPYTYYDIGKIWNKDAAQQDISAASAGVGVHFTHTSGVSGSVGVAWPLTAKPALPIYGEADDPRFSMQTKYNF